jgi:Lsr2
MAKTTVTHVTDDIDGSTDAETVTFGFQGVAYSIDLNQKNLDRLTKLLAPYIESATKQRGRPTRGRSTAVAAAPKTARPYDIAELRGWAAKNKVAVPARGRIPAAVIEQYLAARGQ